MKSQFKFLLISILSVFVFISVFISSRAFFQSQLMAHFIWNLNTFRGLFVHLPDNLPKEHIIGSYAFAFKDYYNHLPRTVSQNAIFYSAALGFLCAVYLPLFFLKQEERENARLVRMKNIVSYVVIAILGLGARLFFAYHTTCNHDIVSWYIDKDILEQGKNVFAVTDRYNYSPFWLLILKFLIKIGRLVPQLPFMFLVRSFLTLVDLITLVVVIQLARVIGFSSKKAAALFFLNPIAIIITGYHGQFDNIPVLCLLLAIYFFLRHGQKMVSWGWFLVTLGIIVKHEILQQVLIFLRQAKRSKVQIIFLFSLSVALFLLSFVPYWKEGSAKILANVFRYGGISRPYGFILLDLNPTVAIVHKYLFIVLLLAWPFCIKTNRLLKSSLLGMLLFLVFTSGISAQQFVLPIALASLQPSSGFYLFTAAASVFLFGNIDELKLPFFEPIGWNYVWIATSIWFVFELKQKAVVQPKTDL